MLVHTVFFNFKENATEADIDAVKAQAEGMAAIEVVKQLYAGRPAPVPQRAVTMSDYDLSLTVVVDNVDDHNTYQDHPIHQAFANDNKHLWKQVRVYDAQ